MVDYISRAIDLADKLKGASEVQEVRISAKPRDVKWEDMAGWKRVWGRSVTVALYQPWLFSNVVEVEMTPTCHALGHLRDKPGQYLSHCYIVAKPEVAPSCSATLRITQVGNEENVGTIESPVVMVSLSATVSMACKLQRKEATVMFDYYADGRIETHDLT